MRFSGRDLVDAGGEGAVSDLHIRPCEPLLGVLVSRSPLDTPGQSIRVRLLEELQGFLQPRADVPPGDDPWGRPGGAKVYCFHILISQNSGPMVSIWREFLQECGPSTTRRAQERAQGAYDILRGVYGPRLRVFMELRSRSGRVVEKFEAARVGSP